MTSAHHPFIQLALSLARSQLGQTWPNPAVGAVIVKDGRIIATGATDKGGRPHAETIALRMAGDKARGATMYVSLEPCAHQGQTPPCTEAIIKAGIATCVIACRDPFEKVSGKGVEQLNAAGINVIEGICTPDALVVNRGFFSVLEKKRPFIALKTATSLDGKVANAKGDSKWITSEPARAYGHLLRSTYDAIVTGSGTALADNPQLTCRLPGLENRSPQRVLFDRTGTVPSSSALLSSDRPAWVMKGTLAENLAELAEKGITRLLVEAGPRLSAAFLKAGLVDRIYWFRAPIIVGDSGLGAIEGEFSEALSALARWKLMGQISLPPDQLDILEPA